MTNKLTASQVKQLAFNVSHDNLRATLMTAIAFAESSYDADATNRNTNGTVDVGLWQINSVHQKEHPEWTVEWLKVPENNAAAAWAVSNKGKTWRPWDSSKENWEKPAKDAIAKEFGKDNPLIPNIIEKPLDATTDAAAAVADTAVNTAQLLGKFAVVVGKTGSWLANPHNWLRIAYVGLGTATVVAGLVKLIGYDSGLAPVKALANTGKQAASSTASKVSDARTTGARSGVPNQSGDVLARGGHS